MTLISQILTDAYRDSGIIAIDDTLDSDKQTEGLRVLNRLYKSLFSHELGEPLTDINYGKIDLNNAYAKALDYSGEIDSAYVPANYRVILNIDAAKTLYLPPDPQDGARFAVKDNAGNLATYNVTVNANGRQIEDADTVVLSTNSLSRQWFYRADTGNWVRVADLAVVDQSPLPEEFDELLILILALRVNPRHGAEMSSGSIEALKRIRKQFRARYKQNTEQDSELGLYRLPSNKNYWRR